MTNIKLIATDLDGTLLHNDKSKPQGFEDFVINHPELTFVIASGRQYYNILAQFPKAASRMVYIAENGGLVFKDDKCLFSNPMCDEDIRASIDRFVEPGVSTVVLCGEKSAYMLNSASDDAKRNASLYYTRFDFVDSFDEVDDRIIKIAIFVEGYVADDYYKNLLDSNDRITYILSGNCWIDIANSTVNKGEGIRVIQEIIGISREETMAFGDYLNDVSLLEACEESYAMENSHPDLKKFCKHIAPSNEDEGVMQVLNQLFG